MTIVRWFALAGALVILAAPDAKAQNRIELEITPFMGGTFFLGDPPDRFRLHRQGTTPMIFEGGTYDDAWTLGMNAGLRVNERWAIEGMFAWLPTTLSEGRGLRQRADVNGYMYGVTGLYYFLPGTRVMPFVGAGVGGQTYDYEGYGLNDHSHWMGNVVAGLSFPIADRFALRLEARDCFARFDSGVAGVDDAWENDLMLTVGLGWRTPLGR